MGNLEFVCKILSMYLDSMDTGNEHNTLDLMHDEVRKSVTECLAVMQEAQIKNLEKIIRDA